MVRLVARSSDQRDFSVIKPRLADGFSFIFGFTVYAGFESAAVAKSGVLNMPGPKEKVQGGHAVMATMIQRSVSSFAIRGTPTGE